MTPLTASSRLSEIGCEKFQMAPGNLLQLAVHRGDQPVLVLMEDRPPFFLGQKIDEVLRIEEACGVRAIIRASHLRDDLRDFGK